MTDSTTRSLMKKIDIARSQIKKRELIPVDAEYFALKRERIQKKYYRKMFDQ